MVFDNKAFRRVVLEFLGDSVKHTSEIESCWSKIKQCIANMDHTVVSFAQHEQDRLANGTNSNRPQPVDLGSGKCSSTMVKSDGCGATIKSREELLCDGNQKWSAISKKKQKLKRKLS